MDVYLIPVSPLAEDRYELYCERVVDDEALNAEAPAGTGRVASILHRFRHAVARVEQEEESGVVTPADAAGGWRDRMKQRSLRWIAERVAEQRLLWRLRKASDVTLFFPDDLSGDAALAVLRRKLKREADRHLKWSVIDGVLFAASGIAALVPGPNLLAYYFGFRFIGHVLSHLGAKHALNEVQWSSEPSHALTLLRCAVPLDAADRERQVQAVAQALHLPHLATFFERTAIPAA